MNPLPWHSAKRVHWPGGYEDGYVSIRDRDNERIGVIYVGEGTEEECVRTGEIICTVMNCRETVMKVIATQSEIIRGLAAHVPFAAQMEASVKLVEMIDSLGSDADPLKRAARAFVQGVRT